MATAAKVELPLNQDKTAAVLAELRRPTDAKELRSSQRSIADHPTEQSSGMSVFSQVALSEVLVRAHIAKSRLLTVCHVCAHSIPERKHSSC